jgi:hypothetical protein
MSYDWGAGLPLGRSIGKYLENAGGSNFAQIYRGFEPRLLYYFAGRIGGCCGDETRRPP